MGLMGTIIARYPGRMRASPLADLRRGGQFLWLWPAWGLSLAALGTLLSALAPFLQMRFRLPDTPGVIVGLTLAATLPLDLYFIPRFLLAADARVLDHPLNPRAHWKAAFEARWMPAFGARMLLYLLVFAGATCFVFPGLVLLALCGWGPWRVLLRGEPVREAMRASVLVMLRRWPPVVLSALLISAVCFLLSALVTYGLTHANPQPTAWQRLTSPAIWGADFVGMACSLWLSASFLSLFHRLESSEAQQGAEGQPKAEP